MSSYDNIWTINNDSTRWSILGEPSQGTYSHAEVCPTAEVLEPPSPTSCLGFRVYGGLV